MHAQPNIQYPLHRPRRVRQSAMFRRLTQEHTLTCNDLVYPIFIHEEKEKAAIPSLPGQYRHGERSLLSILEQAQAYKIPAIALFPVINTAYKTEDAKACYDPNGLVPRTIQYIKQHAPEIAVITDVALDPYTSHGQDGLLNPHGEIVNDATVQVLVEQALCHARAGADVVAPSDMMDGRIGQIRQALEREDHTNVQIIAYSAKYASGLYGPFRDAVGSASNLGQADKNSYQMHIANSDEALREVSLDIAEGADIVMIKPASFYLDIIQRVKQQFAFPTFAYQVSGEYTMLELTANQGYIDRDQAILESLLSIKRAGADAIFTYFALDVAKMLS
ncbi:MAG: porphobilinogen synthase [Zetaproteobacteria bacterium]|nr:porphobilinogen synthase [Zetaproteobacteria bacterium]